MRIVVDGAAPVWAQDLARQVDIALQEALEPRQYVVARLPSPLKAGATVYVADEVGGPVLAFSDGTSWRRSTDREIVS